MQPAQPPLPDVVVPTADVAAVRTLPAVAAFTAVYAFVYVLGFIAFLAVSVYYNAFRDVPTGTSFLLGLAWTVPFPIAAHVLHLLVTRGRRAGRRRTARQAAARIDAEAVAAGYPHLDVQHLARILLEADNGPMPYTGVGKEPFQPLLRWDVRTEAPALVVTAVREGDPETTRITVSARSAVAAVSAPAASTGSAVSTGSAAQARARQAAHTGPRRPGVQLLGAYRSDLPAAPSASRLGGIPAVPSGFVWPRCAEHDEPLQFIAQLEDAGRLILVFVCEIDPGSCDSWDPDSGCNAALVVSGRDLRPADVPATGGTVDSGEAPVAAVLPAEPWLLGVRHTTDADFGEAAAAATADGVTVAGQWHGEPEFIQDDETPDDYRFVAMLTESPLGVNFGGGHAYVFADDHGHAKVLWQQ